ncbi:AMP-binding protein [Streptomyces albus]
MPVVTGPACGAETHDYELLIADRRKHHDWPRIDERDAAVLCHTTGPGTGPRGIAYSHRALYLHALQTQTPQAYGIGEHDVVLPAVPMSRMLAWGLPYAAFAGGASLLLPGAHHRPAPLAELLERERPTLAVADPATWDGLLAELASRPRDLSSLREAVVVGGPGQEPGGPLRMRALRDLGQRDGGDGRTGLSTAAAWGVPEALSPACVARSAADGGAGYRFPASVEYGVLGPDQAPLPWDGRSQGELLLRGPWITASYVQPPGGSGSPATPGGTAGDGTPFATGSDGALFGTENADAPGGLGGGADSAGGGPGGGAGSAAAPATPEGLRARPPSTTAGCAPARRPSSPPTGGWRCSHPGPRPEATGTGSDPGRRTGTGGGPTGKAHTHTRRRTRPAPAPGVAARPAGRARTRGRGHIRPAPAPALV